MVPDLYKYLTFNSLSVLGPSPVSCMDARTQMYLSISSYSTFYFSFLISCMLYIKFPKSIVSEIWHENNLLSQCSYGKI